MTDKQQGLTRRDFAKLSAAAGFAVVTGNAFAAEKNSDTLKIGLIGCGRRGTAAAIDMLTGNDNVMLTAMADLFPDRLEHSRNALKNHKKEEVAKKYAVDDGHCFLGLDAYKKLLETDVDVVMVAALPYSRPQHVEAIVAAKKHLFTEKPAAVDPDGVRRIMAAAETAKQLNLSWVAGTQRRHQRDYIETIDKIHNGVIGEVLFLRAFWCGSLNTVFDRKPEWSDLEHCIRNWYAFCWVAGDSIVEQHVHNIDVCNWVMGGHPVRAFGLGGRAWKPPIEKYGDIWDHFGVEFEYENGVRMESLSRHWNHTEDKIFEEVIGTKGKSNCLNLGKAGRNPYEQEHIDLIASIRGTGPHLNEGARVAESTMTAIMGRMAAYTGHTQTWNKALNTSLNLVPEDLSFDKKYPVGPIPCPVKL